jgi:hypothetical protein
MSSLESSEDSKLVTLLVIFTLLGPNSAPPIVRKIKTPTIIDASIASTSADLSDYKAKEEDFVLIYLTNPKPTIDDITSGIEALTTLFSCNTLLNRSTGGEGSNT